MMATKLHGCCGVGCGGIPKNRQDTPSKRQGKAASQQPITPLLSHHCEAQLGWI